MAKQQQKNVAARPPEPDSGGGATAVAEFEVIDPRTIAPPGSVVGDTAPGATPSVATVPPADAAPPAPREDAVRTAMVEVPLLHVERAYVPRTIRRAMRLADAQTLKDVLDALTADGARMESGRKVVDVDDALAWLLERIRAGTRA